MYPPKENLNFPIQGPNMIKYAKKIVLKKFKFKNNRFSTLKLKTYLNCILKS
jgi:hypothetical protein